MPQQAAIPVACGCAGDGRQAHRKWCAKIARVSMPVLRVLSLDEESMSTMTLTDHLAAALRRMPCTCKRVGEWPIFQRADKAETCARCEALARYDAEMAKQARS